MKRHLSWLLLLILVGSGCDKGTGRPEAVKPMGVICGDFDPAEKVPDDWLRCSSDAECVRAHDDCCDCDGGSDGVAIAAAYQECLVVDCAKPTECPASKACEDTRVVCSDGLCALAPLPAAAAPPTVDCAGYQPGTAEVPDALLECESESDCALATFTCCPCSSNGDQVAVSAKYAECIKGADCKPMQICSNAYRCDEYAVECRDRRCVRLDKNPAVEVQLD